MGRGGRGGISLPFVFSASSRGAARLPGVGAESPGSAPRHPPRCSDALKGLGPRPPREASGTRVPGGAAARPRPSPRLQHPLCLQTGRGGSRPGAGAGQGCFAPGLERGHWQRSGTRCSTRSARWSPERGTAPLATNRRRERRQEENLPVSGTPPAKAAEAMTPRISPPQAGGSLQGNAGGQQPPPPPSPATPGASPGSGLAMPGARPCPGKQPSPLASRRRRQPPLCAPATDVAKKASSTELKRENLENNGVCPPLGRSWELGRARLLFRGPRLLPEHPRVPPAAAFLGGAGPRGTRQRFGDGTRWNSGHRRAAAAGRARDWEYWGAGRGARRAEGVKEETAVQFGHVQSPYYYNIL